MISGNILKMKTSLKDNTAQYQLPVGDQLIDLNSKIGKKIKLEFTGQINCIATGELISKSYNQGYSYKSFISLAACDICIVKPELCHFAKGTCREPEWAKTHCLIDHYVYLANTGDVKVGITRHNQIPHRWIDQGATEALPILKVKDRKTSGLIEQEITAFIGDKTNWRKMLRGDYESINLTSIREDLFDKLEPLIEEFNADIIEERQVFIEYPVLQSPPKMTSLSFDKTKLIEGELLGIKGQYLIFENGVLNIRKHQGYYLNII